ncbi:MAG: ArnT family glycosyltransferase [Ignavibacteria bacterium]
MKKIYLILLITFLIRLYHINFPVLGWHSWRQSDTATIAKNFYENGFNILYPQISWGGAGTGYVESEFQIYPLIVSVLYAVFSVNDMWGRVVSVIFSMLTVYGLYLLVRKIMSEQAALWSALIYAIIPLNIYYGRAFMPESTMLVCSVYSIYFFSEWLDKEKTKYFIYSWLFTCFAVLVKLPTLYIGLPLLYLAFQKYKFNLFKNLKIWLLFGLVIIPVILWYYHAHQLFLNGGASFGIWTFGQDKWGTFELVTQPSFYADVFFKSIAERHLTYPGFILLLIGLFIKREYELERLFDFWLLAVLTYFFIAAQGVRVHEYYQLPIDLPAAVFIGKVFTRYLPLENIKVTFKTQRYKSYCIILCLVLICILSYLRFANFMKSERWDSPVFKIANDVKAITPKNDLIITVSNGNPVYLYHCDRKGWTALPQHLDIKHIESLKKEGAKWLTGEKGSFVQENSLENLNKILSNYKIRKNNNNYFIVELTDL